MKEKAGLYKGKDYATTARDSSDPRLRKVVEIFSRYKFDRLLDVGCGDGNLSLMLKEASNANEVYGIEISSEGVELATKAGVKAYRLDIDAGDFPFKDNFFDAVFCGEVIEHLYNPDHLLEEVHRTLKPGGLLILSTPNLAWWLSRVALLLGFYPFGLNPSSIHPAGHIRELTLSDGSTPVFYDHVRLFTVPALLKLLRIRGFVINKVVGIGGQVPAGIPFSKIINLADIALSKAPSLSFRFVVCATKK